MIRSQASSPSDSVHDSADKGLTPAPLLLPRRTLIPKLAWMAAFALLAVVLAYLGAIRAYQQYCEANSPTERVPLLPLTIPDAELRLGPIFESSPHECSFHITNPNDRPVVITFFERTCECLGISPEPEATLPAHESVAFVFQLSPHAPTEQPSLDRVRPYTVRFAARFRTDEGQSSSTEWQLSCDVVPTIRYKPIVIQVGTQSDRRTGIEQTIAIDAAANIQRIECEAPEGWKVEFASHPEKAVSHSFTASVRARGTLPRGELSDKVLLFPVDQSGRRLLRKELRIVGNIVPDIRAVPGELNLGNLTYGLAAEEGIRLQSLLNYPFQVIDAASSGDDLALQPLAKDDPYVFLARIAVRHPGQQEAVARFTCLDNEGRRHVVAVPIRYTGLDQGSAR